MRQSIRRGANDGKLTIHVQNEAGFLGLDELRVQRLTGEYGVQVGTLHRWPQQSVLDNVARIMLVLIVDL